MSQVVVYSTDPCSYCARAKALLRSRAIPFQEINLARDPDGRARLSRKTGLMTFPQILIDDVPIGGWDELRSAVAAGRLDGLTEAEDPGFSPGDPLPAA